MDQRAFQPAPEGLIESVTYYAEGEEAMAFRPADFILTHGDAWTSRMIRFGQRLRFRGEDRPFAHWNHAAIIVAESGDIIEALGAGVQRRHLSVYREPDYRLVALSTSDENRAEAVRFVRWAAGEVDPETGEEIPPDRRRPVRYGFLTIVSIAYSLLTGGKFSFSVAGQEICSGLAARALERAGMIFPDRPPTHVMPADLARSFGAPGPARP